MDRVTEFLNLYGAVEQRLKDIVGPEHRNKHFYQIVQEAARRSSTVRNVSNQLANYTALRNALSHNRPAGESPIAEPTEAGLAVFRAIAARILNPPPLSTAMKTIEPFEVSTPLLSVLRYMRERDFSQVVIWSPRDAEQSASLLTVEGIARWFEFNVELGPVGTAGRTLGEVLPYNPSDSFTVMGPADTVDDAREALVGQPGLYAIIVTAGGRQTAKPVGIVTAWDLLDAQR